MAHLDPYVPTSTTLPTHKSRRPHCSNSLSDSLSVKRRPQVVLDRRHRYILFHQSRGAEKWLLGISVMVRFHYGLQVNSWSCSSTELVCRRQLYTIERPSISSTVRLGLLWRPQWHGEYRVWKWIISTKYVKKENAYIWQNTRCGGAKTHCGDDYHMTINTVGPGVSSS